MTGKKVLALWDDLAMTPEDSGKIKVFCDSVLLLTHHPQEWAQSRDEVTARLGKLARAGVAPALTALGIILLTGKNRQNAGRALEMLEKAADAGDEEALRILGEKMRDGIPGVLEKNVNKARECFEKLDAAGNDLGSVLLAKLYRLGSDEIPRDYMKAFGLLKKVADKKNTCMGWAAFDVGNAYLEGSEDVPFDPKKAIHYFKIAEKCGVFTETKMKAAVTADRINEKPLSHN